MSTINLSKKIEKRVVRIEATGGKHVKRPTGGYGVPVIYHLEDGTQKEWFITGSRLKDAKARVERLVNNVGDRVLEFWDGGVVIERSTY